MTNLKLDSAEKIIVALDGMDGEEAISFVSRISGLRWVKVGLELFLTEGPSVLEELREKGLSIFLDLKFHDIPATLQGACRRAAATGAELLTVHSSAGFKALSLAKEAASEGAADAGYSMPKILAVTVLTSWDDKSFVEELGINQSIRSRVEQMASLAAKAGLDGCICSPLEAKSLRLLHPLPFELVTPGIRLNKDPLDDQARVTCPSEALKAGATRLVIGRPITRANDPSEMFINCCREIESAF